MAYVVSARNMNNTTNAVWPNVRSVNNAESLNNIHSVNNLIIISTLTITIVWGARKRFSTKLYQENIRNKGKPIHSTTSPFIFKYNIYNLLIHNSNTLTQNILTLKINTYVPSKLTISKS